MLAKILYFYTRIICSSYWKQFHWINTICQLHSWHIISVSTLIRRGEFNLLNSFFDICIVDKTGVNARIASHFCQFYANQRAKKSIILFLYSIMPCTIIVSLPLLQPIWCNCFSIFLQVSLSKVQWQNYSSMNWEKKE